MTEQEINDKNQKIICWSCDKQFSMWDMMEADGFCPFCKCEVEIDE